MRRRLFVLALVAAWLPCASARAQVGERAPLRVVVFVDSSEAMVPYLNQFRASLAQFLEALPGEPEVVLGSIGGQFRVRAGPTADRSKVTEAAARFTSDHNGNTLLESLIEADRRFLQKAPDRRPVLVILTTDMGGNVGEGRIEAYNRFMNDFVARGGRAHAVVIRGQDDGVTTRIAENLVRNTGGFYEAVIAATAAPKLMALVAKYVGADE